MDAKGFRVIKRRNWDGRRFRRRILFIGDMENTTMIAMSSEGAPKKEHEHMRRHHLHYGTINWEIVLVIILCLYSFWAGIYPFTAFIGIYLSFCFVLSSAYLFFFFFYDVAIDRIFFFNYITKLWNS
jgi:hypothetical protein